jgi:hypothetical protein
MSGFLDDFLTGKKTAEERQIEAALQAARARRPKRDVLVLAEGFADPEDDADEEDAFGGHCGSGGGGCGGGACGGQNGCGH